MKSWLARTATVVALVIGASATSAAIPAGAGTPDDDTSRREAFADARAGDASGGEVHTASDASFTDAAQDGNPTDECAGDILYYGGSSSSSSMGLWVNTRCGSNPSSSANWVEGISHIIWGVDVNLDGSEDYTVFYDNIFSLEVTVYDISGGGFTKVCTAVAGWNGNNSFSASIPPACFGNPGAFSMSAYMLWDEAPFSESCICPQDYAPEGLAWAGPILRSDPPVPVGDGPGAASAEPGELDVFVRGADDALYTRHFDGAIWSGYASLGGIITSTPAVASPGTGQLDVFVRGQDNKMYTQHFNGSTWSGWTSLGGILTTAPAVVSRQPGSLDVFVAGFDRALYTMHFDGTNWSGWTNLGGIITATPAAASANTGQMSVFARGQDNAMWTQFFNGANWSGWNSLGGIITTAPGAVSSNPGTLAVFARGQDNALWINAFSGGWGGWVSLGGVIASPPAAASPSSGVIEVFVRGQDAALYHNRNGGGGFGGWQSLGGVIK